MLRVRSPKFFSSTNNRSARDVSVPVPGFYDQYFTNHLANERTFLAWIRTALALITFGTVAERFGERLVGFNQVRHNSPFHPYTATTVIGLCFIFLGIFFIISALWKFLQVRRAIECQRFYSHTSFAVVLTTVTSCVGVLLAIFLLLMR